MSAPERAEVGESERVREIAQAVLRAYVEGAAGNPLDPGPPAAARALVETGGDQQRELAGSVLRKWSTARRSGQLHFGLSDGAAGLLVGLRVGGYLEPNMTAVESRLTTTFEHSVPEQLAHARERPRGFGDYDLIVGPAGTLLALLVPSVSTAPAETAGLVRTLAEYLGEYCDNARLDGLRVDAYADHQYLDWMQGRVNSGLGHGVPGVLLALSAAVHELGPEAVLLDPLRRAADWLAAGAFVDELGVTSWLGGELLPGEQHPSGPMRRQAWCYGTPGVAWALWEAGTALGDGSMTRLAESAFDSMARAFDERWHLFGTGPEELLTLCHGAAGVLTVADCFWRHAGVDSAQRLRNRLVNYLIDSSEDLRTLARAESGLLNGACGAVALLLSTTGADRGWLRCVGLR